MMNFKKVVGILAALSALQVAQAEEVKIGFVGPMTGSVTQYGNMVLEGVNTAIEELNAKAGPNGRTYKLVKYDDACEPKQAVTAANNVKRDKVNFVIGHVCSGATLSAVGIYDQEGIVMITPSATAPTITEGKKYATIFRTIGRDDQQGPAAAKYIIEKAKPKRIAVLHDKQSYGQGIATSVKKALDAAKMNVVVFDGINAGATDFSSIITKMKAQNVDFVYFGGYHPEMGLLLRQAQDQGLKAKFMGPEGTGNPDIQAIAGKSVEGMLLTLPADFASNPANAELVKTFKAKKRSPDGAFQMPAYSAMKIIAAAIDKANSTDPEKVAAVIHSSSFATPIGKVEYTKDGDLKDFNFAIYEWHYDGTKTQVK